MVDGGVKFVDVIYPAAIGMEDEMARSRLDPPLPEGGLAWCKCSGGGVDLVNPNAIRTEIVDEQPVATGCGSSFMNVRVGVNGKIVDRSGLDV